MDIVNIGNTDENADWIKTLSNVSDELEIHAALAEEQQEESQEEPEISE